MTCPLAERGRLAMDVLAASVRLALEQKGLVDMRILLDTRLLNRHADELEEFEPCADGVVRRCYKPFAELALREVLWLTRTPHLSLNQRRTVIRWTLLMAGF